MARTQQQRREETVGRLLDASIATIIDVGYARASAAAITERAHLSDGALFRHFPTMGDFMAATAHEVIRRQLALFTKQIAEIPSGKPALEAVLTILRDLTSNDTSAVLYELLVAARTDAKLRATLRHVLTEYAVEIFAVARALPIATRVPEELLPALVATLTSTFDGAAILRPVLPSAELEAGRVAVLMELLNQSQPPGRGRDD